MAERRVKVVYDGRVQGVGFRATAARIASGLQVRGSVRNLPNGRVELVAAGEADEVGRLLLGISEAMGRKIVEAVVEDDPTGEPPTDFRILY